MKKAQTLSEAGNIHTCKGKRKGYVIGILFLLVILTGLACMVIQMEKESVPVSGEESVSETLKYSIVRIEAPISDASEGEKVLQGSGVILKITEDYIDIATASHVVEQTARPLIYFFDGSLAYGSVAAYGKESDVAFVRVYGDELEEGSGKALQEAELLSDQGYAEVTVAEEVIFIGSVTQVAGEIMYGTIKEKERFVELFQNDMLICDAVTLDGMSGGGVFTTDGALIGILVGSNGEEAVSVALPEVMEEYNSSSL